MWRIASFAEPALADPGQLVARPPSVPWEVAGGVAAAGGTAGSVIDRLAVSIELAGGTERVPDDRRARRRGAGVTLHADAAAFRPATQQIVNLFDAGSLEVPIHRSHTPSTRRLSAGRVPSRAPALLLPPCPR